MSIDSSLITQSTSPNVSSNGRAYRTTKSGSQHKFVSHSHCPGKGSLLVSNDNPFTKDIIARTQALVEISLSTKTSWPAGQDKKEVAFDASNQANMYAREHGWPMLETNHECIQTVRCFVYVFWSQSPHPMFCLYI